MDGRRCTPSGRPPALGSPSWSQEVERVAEVVAEIGAHGGPGRCALAEDARTVQVDRSRALLLDVAVRLPATQHAVAHALGPDPALR